MLLVQHVTACLLTPPASASVLAVLMCYEERPHLRLIRGYYTGKGINYLLLHGTSRKRAGTKKYYLAVSAKGKIY
jgi:hypothetical protein